jgi:hypothetical protein
MYVADPCPARTFLLLPQAVVEHEPRTRPEDGSMHEAEAALLGAPLACPDDVAAAEEGVKAAALASGDPQPGGSTSKGRGKGGRGGRAAGAKAAAAAAVSSPATAAASPADTPAPESRAASEEGPAAVPDAAPPPSVVAEAKEAAVVVTTTEAVPMAVDTGEPGAAATAVAVDATTVVAVSVAETNAAAAGSPAPGDKQGSPPPAAAMEVTVAVASEETTTTAAGAPGPGTGTSTGTSTNGTAPPAGGRTPQLRQGVRATRFQQQQQQQQLQQQQPPAAASGGKEGTPSAGPPAPTYPPDLTFVRSTRIKLGHAGNNMAARHAVMDAAMTALDNNMGPLVQVRLLCWHARPDVVASGSLWCSVAGNYPSAYGGPLCGQQGYQAGRGMSHAAGTVTPDVFFSSLPETRAFYNVCGLTTTFCWCHCTEAWACWAWLQGTCRVEP